jgi:hypothetical protein
MKIAEITSMTFRMTSLLALSRRLSVPLGFDGGQESGAEAV